VRPYLKNTHHKKGLAEWLKVFELRDSELKPTTRKKKKKVTLSKEGQLQTEGSRDPLPESPNYSPRKTIHPQTFIEQLLCAKSYWGRQDKAGRDGGQSVTPPAAPGLGWGCEDGGKAWGPGVWRVQSLQGREAGEIKEESLQGCEGQGQWGAKDGLGVREGGAHIAFEGDPGRKRPRRWQSRPRRQAAEGVPAANEPSGAGYF
jgi:hypothetical protein